MYQTWGLSDTLLHIHTSIYSKAGVIFSFLWSAVSKNRSDKEKFG